MRSRYPHFEVFRVDPHQPSAANLFCTARFFLFDHSSVRTSTRRHVSHRAGDAINNTGLFTVSGGALLSYKNNSVNGNTTTDGAFTGVIGQQ